MYFSVGRALPPQLLYAARTRTPMGIAIRVLINSTEGFVLWFHILYLPTIELSGMWLFQITCGSETDRTASRMSGRTPVDVFLPCLSQLGDEN